MLEQSTLPVAVTGTTNRIRPGTGIKQWPASVGGGLSLSPTRSCHCHWHWQLQTGHSITGTHVNVGSIAVAAERKRPLGLALTRAGVWRVKPAAKVDAGSPQGNFEAEYE